MLNAEFAVDSSALVAMFNGEAEQQRFETATSTGHWLIGCPTILEVRIWLMRNRQAFGATLLDQVISNANVTVIPFDGALEALASDAFSRFGKGRHPARLNYGDCMTYAVAKQAGVPLLFKGEDFRLTDIIPHPASLGEAA